MKNVVDFFCINKINYIILVIFYVNVNWLIVYMDQKFLDKIKTKEQEFLCGEYSIGRYAWILEDIEPITPIPDKGHLNIWNYQVNT